MFFRFPGHPWNPERLGRNLISALDPNAAARRGAARDIEIAENVLQAIAS